MLWDPLYHWHWGRASHGLLSAKHKAVTQTGLFLGEKSPLMGNLGSRDSPRPKASLNFPWNYCHTTFLCPSFRFPIHLGSDLYQFYGSLRLILGSASPGPRPAQSALEYTVTQVNSAHVILTDSNICFWTFFLRKMFKILKIFKKQNTNHLGTLVIMNPSLILCAYPVLPAVESQCGGLLVTPSCASLHGSSLSWAFEHFLFL